MQIITDGLWLCSGCTYVACNGEHGAALEKREATLAGLERLGRNLVSAFDSETGEGLRTFSSIPCECCGTRLKGYRAEFAVLG